MANVAGAAIVKRIREIIDDGAGSIRTVSSSRFEGDAPSGILPEETHRRSVVKPRFEVTLTKMSRNVASPPPGGNLALLDVFVRIRCTYALEIQGLADDDRDAIRAAAFVDSDVIRQALEWEGNLTQTAASVATGLVSGRLEHLDSTLESENFADDVRQAVWVHEFKGVANVTQAIA